MKSENYMHWMCCNAMIKGFLNTAMEKDIRLSVKHANITMIFGEILKKDSRKRVFPERMN